MYWSYKINTFIWLVVEGAAFHPTLRLVVNKDRATLTSGCDLRPGSLLDIMDISDVVEFGLLRVVDGNDDSLLAKNYVWIVFIEIGKYLKKKLIAKWTVDFKWVQILFVLFSFWFFCCCFFSKLQCILWLNHKTIFMLFLYFR